MPQFEPSVPVKVIPLYSLEIGEIEEDSESLKAHVPDHLDFEPTIPTASTNMEIPPDVFADLPIPKGFASPHIVFQPKIDILSSTVISMEYNWENNPRGPKRYVVTGTMVGPGKCLP